MKTLVKELFVRYSYQKQRSHNTAFTSEDWAIIPVLEDWTSLDAVTNFEIDMERKVGEIQVLSVNLV